MNLDQEKELIQKARKDPEVFGEIFEKYYLQIFHYTLKRVADVKLAEDITSEVFFKAFDKLWQFRFKKVSFSAWLFKITHHEIAHYFRKKKYPQVSFEALVEKDVISSADIYDLKQEIIEMEELFQQKKLFLKVQKELQKLPLKYQEVLSLRFFENKKVKEIGFLLNKKEGTIKSLISRGLQMLKKKLPKNATL
jgi:RNA polymerase sigma-70 factor (ECF subfamily)